MKSFNEWCECWEVELHDEMQSLGLSPKERQGYLVEQHRLYVEDYEEQRIAEDGL